MNALTDLTRLFRSDRGRRKLPPLRRRLVFEPLETRLLLSVSAEFLGPVSLSVGSIVNISQLANNQQEETIAINPTAPGNLIAASNDAVSGNPNDIIWFSTNGGSSWTQVAIPNLPARGPAGDPTVVFNRSGTALYGHLDGGGIAAAVSTTGGMSWTAANIDANTADDKEFLAVGPDFNNLAQDRFYIGWQRSNNLFVSSSTNGTVWAAPVQVNDNATNRGIVSQMAVGPNGELHYAWQTSTDAFGSRVLMDTSPDGGVTWGTDQLIATTDITLFADPGPSNEATGGLYLVPAAQERGIGASLSIDVDRTGGPNDGIVYLAFMDQFIRDGATGSAAEHDDTEVYVARATAAGTLIPGSITRISDDPTINTQFEPWLSLDQTTGALSVTWHDARSDDGVAGRKAGANNDVQYWGTFSLDGTTWAPNVPITTAFSSEDAAEPFDAGFFDLDYGDYSGNAFFGGIFHPVWTDNSNSTGDNPNLATNNDIYTAAVTLTSSGGMVLNIFGDSDFINQDDEFKTILDPSGDFIQVWENNSAMVGLPDFTAALDAVSISVANGMRYDGGTGFDRLNLVQTDGPTQASDVYSVGPNVGEGTSIITGAGPAGTQTVVFQELEPVLDLVPAALLTVNATPADNAVNYTQGSVPANGLVTIDNFESLEFSNKTALAINALAGSDAIDLHNPTTPTGLTGSITVNGGDPTASDTLVVNGSPTLFDNLRHIPTGAGEGSVVNDNGPQPPVNFTGIEHLTLVVQQVDGDGVRLDGTTGNDRIEFFHGPTGDSGTFRGTLDTNNTTGGGPFALTETTYSGVNVAANDVDINFFVPGGTDTFEFDGTAANDTIAVGFGEAGGTEFRNTINGAVVARLEVFNTAGALVRGGDGDDTFNHAGAVTIPVSYEGGDPSASDRLVVTSPGGPGVTAVYTPTPSGGGTLDLPGTSLVTFAGIEQVVYDGQANNDTLKVMGTGGDDTIVHTPGANNQAGSFQVDGLLAISYQNMGGGATLQADGLGGADTLVLNGTAAADTFSIAGTGAVTLNARLPVTGLNIEALTLKGLDGDDTFTLVPAVQGSPYSMVNLDGGPQGSADHANLVGTSAADTFTLSGAGLTQGTKTVNLINIEDARLDALGGNDQLIYNGVSGLVEAITVGSSGVAGGGQVSVPGVVQLAFVNLETIDVNGNTGVGGDEDTLTFAGTNGADVFQINLGAAGTDADPIVKLQNASAVTLLTLRNYTNIATLRVNGLDGEDVFNVLTGPLTPENRNLFVDGGQPTGKKKSTDTLNIFYTAPRPKIIQSAAQQDPDAGLADLNYGTARYVIQWDDVEDVIIRKG